VTARRLVATCCASLTLAACGLKGPLELPEKSGGVTIRTATGETTTTGGPKTPTPTPSGPSGQPSTTTTTPVAPPAGSTATTPGTTAAPASKSSANKVKRNDVDHPPPPPLPGGNPGD